ncbi:conserved hypothetical protein [Ricinus communis]|uniref:Uncharacterized protein n=1 Tax=Ricinus communis TaxID=3988 RepID=B9RAH8_RICCO|nr:conserved hypothetical protein [Ricinus communis]
MIGGGEKVWPSNILGEPSTAVQWRLCIADTDPHHTGNDEYKKITNGGWKQAVDGKGKKFFLHDKFYNSLLPQKPNMV